MEEEKVGKMVEDGIEYHIKEEALRELRRIRR
jgi:hypothetical protein